MTTLAASCNCYQICMPLQTFFRTTSVTTSAPVSRATLGGTVRWILTSVCLVLVRMEGHVLTLLTGTAVTVAVSFR